MIEKVTFSKPTATVKEKFGRDYIRIKIRAMATDDVGAKDVASNDGNAALNDEAAVETDGHGDGQRKYFAECLTKTQAFHKHFSAEEVDAFIEEHAGKTFSNCVVFTDTEEITIQVNRSGKISRRSRKLKMPAVSTPTTKACLFASPFSQDRHSAKKLYGNNRVKNYILREGVAVPFLVELGVMTASGKVIASKYDKFRQVNRFLEFVNDILPEVTARQNASETEGLPMLRIVDFGSGKSYLTFAVHYFLTEIKKMRVDITGLDLKKDVIDNCSRLAQKLKCAGLRFEVGDIANYKTDDNENADVDGAANNKVDLMICLHACDTATDFALGYAVKNNCNAILAVPCCQHEVNLQLAKTKARNAPAQFEPLLKYGIVRERFASLVTDALRAEYLEKCGYDVQLLEFIDMEHTPKNILIRALRKTGTAVTHTKATANESADLLVNALGIAPTFKRLVTCEGD